MWNYRVLRRSWLHINGDVEHTFAIHEVYYNDDGVPNSCSKDSIEPHGESMEELQKDFRRQLEAFSKPVLCYETLDIIDDTSTDVVVVDEFSKLLPR